MIGRVCQEENKGAELIPAPLNIETSWVDDMKRELRLFILVISENAWISSDSYPQHWPPISP